MTTETKTKIITHANVTAYRGILAVEWLTKISDETIVTPYDTPGNLGFVAMDTNHIAVSDEAYEILKTKIRKGPDSIGDIDIFRSDDGKYVFGTFGGKYMLIDPSRPEVTGSRTYQCPPRDQFQVIPNDTPEAARGVIDREKPVAEM